MITFQCSVICGDGIKTREVTCYKKTEEGGIEELEESECSGSQPALEEECSNEMSCEAADWIVSGTASKNGLQLYSYPARQERLRRCVRRYPQFHARHMRGWHRPAGRF